MEEKVTKCSVSKKCGSCQYQGVPYKEQLSAKAEKDEEASMEVCKCKTNHWNG